MAKLKVRSVLKFLGSQIEKLLSSKIFGSNFCLLSLSLSLRLLLSAIGKQLTSEKMSRNAPSRIDSHKWDPRRRMVRKNALRLRGRRVDLKCALLIAM